jgi:hypothetical protein
MINLINVCLRYDIKTQALWYPFTEDERGFHPHGTDDKIKIRLSSVFFMDSYVVWKCWKWKLNLALTPEIVPLNALIHRCPITPRTWETGSHRGLYSRLLTFLQHSFVCQSAGWALCLLLTVFSALRMWRPKACEGVKVFAPTCFSNMRH